MIYSSFALDLLSGAASVAAEAVTVLGMVLLASYLFGLWLLVPRATVSFGRRTSVRS